MKKASIINVGPFAFNNDFSKSGPVYNYSIIAFQPYLL